MAGAELKGEERWEKMMRVLERVDRRLEALESGQQSANEVARKAEEERVILARQVDETGKTVSRLRLEWMAQEMEGMDSEPERENRGQREFGRKDHGRGDREWEEREQYQFGGNRNLEEREQYQFGGNRNLEEREQYQFRGNRNLEREQYQFGGNRNFCSTDLSKMSFPKFPGVEPGIWITMCLEYFMIYQVPEFMWASSASLHMEGRAGRWMQVYKMKQGLGDWAHFVQAVQEKFGSEEYSQSMRGLVHMTQRASLDEYIQEFEDSRYATMVHNPRLDETFFVSQFIKGLRGETKGYVMSQLPRTVDRAIALAQIHQEVLEKGGNKFQKGLLVETPRLRRL
jgi:hypothetical protein